MKEQKGITAYFSILEGQCEESREEVVILGFAGGEAYTFGNTLNHAIFAIYYDPKDPTGKLEHCLIEHLYLKPHTVRIPKDLSPH